MVNEVNIQFWDKFYKEDKAVDTPSQFVRYCAENIPENSCIFEIGCGNGRDAKFLANQGHKVIGCDLSQEAINKLSGMSCGKFFVGDFSQLPDNIYHKPINVVYSRFTLHTVTEEEASCSLKWIHRNLASKGLLFIEVRSVKDGLFGKGTQVGKDAFVFDHYRRFIRKEELISELEEIGFEIIKNKEEKGLAVYGDEDPIVIRIVARKI